MKKKVFIYGLSGRMGQEVKKCLTSSSQMTFLGGTSRSEPHQPDQSPDLVIDFSLPQSFPELIAFCKQHGSALVSGTTGLTDEHKQQLRDLGETQAVFWSANMSFGVYLMCQLTERLARFEQFYRFHIEETHHVHKKDKPSGTALMIEDAAKRSTNKLDETISHREGDVFGVHRFTAQSAMEKLEIRHEALDRGLFAQGAVDVAQWLLDQKPGFYSMESFFQALDS